VIQGSKRSVIFGRTSSHSLFRWAKFMWSK